MQKSSYSTIFMQTCRMTQHPECDLFKSIFQLDNYFTVTSKRI